ncbi:MAG: histidine triad nucleotide-binding protein [Legionellales bacterium]|nr:histidine triad nucleotide-binding protein [Legionellales bacterium]
MDCIFCKIINQELTAIIHHENEHLIVLEDIAPKAPVHRLIVPKKHIATLNDLNALDYDIISKMYAAAVMMAKSLDVSENGYRLVTNCNHDGGQTVFHIHMHFMAGRVFHWPPG